MDKKGTYKNPVEVKSANRKMFGGKNKTFTGRASKGLKQLSGWTSRVNLNAQKQRKK